MQMCYGELLLAVWKLQQMSNIICVGPAYDSVRSRISYHFQYVQISVFETISDLLSYLMNVEWHNTKAIGLNIFYSLTKGIGCRLKRNTSPLLLQKQSHAVKYKTLFINYSNMHND